MWVAYLFLAVFILATGAHLFGEWAILQNKSYGLLVRYVSKPLLMPSLGLFYVFMALPNFFEIWIVLGIIGGFGGDVCLMLPDPNKKKTWFKIGLVSFLLGHIFYLFAFIQAGILHQFIGFHWWALLTVIPFIVYGVFLYPRLIPHTGAMKIPVTVYIVVIILMGISTGLLWGVRSWFGILIAMVGAWSFILSDTINAFNKFAHEIPNERLYTMSTYILGQFLLILGFILL